MDPAPSQNSLSTNSHKWEEVWGTAIALLTLILPIAAISTYSPSSPPGNISTEVSTAKK